MKKKNYYGIIYRATNLVNGKVYIGMTSHPLSHRQKCHHDGAFVYNSQFRFHRALRKYGKYNFRWDVIDSALDKDSLCEKEIYWISVYDSFKDCSKGYNMTSGGQSGELSPEAQEKKRQSLKGRVSPMKGKVSEKKGRTLEDIMGSKEKADEAKRKNSESNRERTSSPEFRDRTSKRFKNKPKSKEQIQRMRSSRVRVATLKRDKFLMEHSIDQEVLVNDYVGGTTLSFLAEKHDCSNSTITKYLIMFMGKENFLKYKKP